MSTTVAAADAAPRVATVVRPAAPGGDASALRRAPVRRSIVAGVLFTLRGLRVPPPPDERSPRHPGVLAPPVLVPGAELSAGHLPLWNPNEMLGYRFAADPQSGWLYVPPMLLFSRAVAGRGDARVHRVQPAARRARAVLVPAQGVALAPGRDGRRPVPRDADVDLGHGDLDAVRGLPGWTTIVLVGASGYRHADRWSRRLAWLALSAFAWSQVASAHMSHGLVMCSLLLAAFLIATSVASVRARRDRRMDRAPARTGLFLVAHAAREPRDPDPRLAFIGSSSLHRGYDALGQPRAIDGAHHRPPARDERRVGGVAARVRLRARRLRRRGHVARGPVRVARSRTTGPRRWRSADAWCSRGS